STQLVRHVLASAIEVTEPVTAREQLERLDHMKDEFLSLASHELRTPLTPLAAYMEIIIQLVKRKQRGADWDAQLQAIAPEVLRQIRHLARLIDDLLDVARLQSGKFSLGLTPLPLESLVRDA